jgi:hypothetical protein
MKHLRSCQLVLALLASVASVDAASANPRMGGVVVAPQVSFPRVSPPTNYGSTAGTDAGRSAADAARAGTGAAVFGGTVGGIDSAPRYGNTGGVVPSGKPPSAAPGGGFSPVDKNDESDRNAEIMILLIMAANASDEAKKSASGDKSGSGTKVASKEPTTGTTSTATSTTSLPGPTGGTTTTASLPGDPPDAKKPLTPAEHQALVDAAKNLDGTWRDLDASYNEQQRVINKVTRGGTLTPGEQKMLDDAGGVTGLENHKQATADQRDATYKDAQNAQKEAKKNDSYNHVR